MFGGGNDRIAHIHAHRPGHEAEILCRGNQLGAQHFALYHQHRLFLAGAFLRGFHPVRVFFLVAELKRVGQGRRNLNFLIQPAVEEPGKALARGQCHMVAAIGADLLVVGQLSVEQHRPAFGAFFPQVFRHLSFVEERADRGANVIGDPVHGASLRRLCAENKQSLR